MHSSCDTPSGVAERSKHSKPIEHFDVIVLGAGISGLVSASLLAQQNSGRVLVVDEYPHLGGNHIDRQHGNFTFDVGSFIFQDDSPLLRHFPELLSLYTPIKPSFARLNPQGIVTKYPISIKDDIFVAGPIEWARMLVSVATARVFFRKMHNARHFARYWIGSRLLERSGLLNYMERFYGVHPDLIDIDFAEKRMLWIKEHASFNFVLRWLRSAPGGPSNQQLARPREGFGRLYSAAAERLERVGVTFLLGAEMHTLRKARDTFVLEARGHCLEANRVISTIPIRRIQRLCGISREVDLKTVTLISLFFSFSGERGFTQSVLFNFSNLGAWKRLTMHSDFYGLSEGREFFAVEVNADHVGESVELAERDFRQHVSENGLFLGDLRLEGSYSLENSYPVYTHQAGEHAGKAIKALSEIGIESFGRQGGFDYQPTARASTLEAEAALAPK